MSEWTADELDKIGAADELEIAPNRSDGTRYPYTTIWVVRVDDHLYVRSYRGPNGKWFRHAREQAEGHIRAGGVDRDVGFEHPEDGDSGAVDQVDLVYRMKYARYGGQYVDAIVSPQARATTLRLVAR
jgi:hypothetical protein